jgi:alpha-L-fucosidase
MRRREFLISGAAAAATAAVDHFHRDPVADSVTLKPLRRLPARATLLNTGRPVACTVDMAPSDHLAQAAYLRLTNLPANELSNTAMVVKLEFDGDPAS